MERLRRRIDYILKHNIIAQTVYKFIMSNFFRFIGLFVSIDERLFLFNGHGKKYNDSPMYIFEYLVNHPEYKKYKFVWALDDPEEHDIPYCEKVKMDTMRYFITALKSKYWVTCVNIERGLKFKKKQTVYLNTWHGIPLKLVGNSVKNRRDFDFSNVNIFCYSGSYEREIYIKDFNVLEENLFLSGLPRNDVLYDVSEEKMNKLKDNLSIPVNKTVILYAPTWRDSKDFGKTYSIKPPLDMDYLYKELGDRYVIILKTHPYTNKVFNIEFNDFLIDYTNYPNINDLLIVSDILVTDYSAVIFDYSILERPVICFGYDYEEYASKRGFYINLEDELPNGVISTQEELVDRIKNLDYNKECEKTAEFKRKYIQVAGNATEKCVRKLMGYI